MTDSLRFGFAVPQIFPERMDLDLLHRTVVAAERAGFESLWVMDSATRPGRSARALDALHLLSHVAAVTGRARLGVSVLVTPVRHPVQLAKDLATLDQLSGGRLIVGVGLGRPRMAPVWGLEEQGWARRYDEGLEALVRLWEPGTASYHGEHVRFDDLSVEPKPLQQPRPPLWFGAKAERPMRRAARLGEGWMGAGSSSTDDFEREAPVMRRILDEEGKAEFVVSKRIYLAIGEDSDLDRRVAGWFGHVYGRPEEGPRCAVFGPPSRCAQEIARLAEAGAEMIVVNPMFDQPRQLERFVEEVQPLLG